MVVVCADESECERMARGLAFFTGQSVPVLTARQFTFHNAATVSHQWEHRRLKLLWALSEGELPCLVASVEALQQRTLPPDVLKQATLELATGQQINLNDLAACLTAAGYTRCQQVEGPGQFALRGGILDVFSPAMDAPVRAEFWGDEVDAMGSFDPATQRAHGESGPGGPPAPARKRYPSWPPGVWAACWLCWTNASPKRRRTATRS